MADYGMQYSEDRLTYTALLIPYADRPVWIDSIETFNVTKSDNGDAGTWALTAALGMGHTRDAAAVIAPMDIIAIFAQRVSHWDDGTIETGAPLPKQIDPTWKWGDATTIHLLAAHDSCIMIGMVDHAEETPWSESAKATFACNGRDLTKILIDNDVLVPFTVPGGGTDGQSPIASIMQMALSRADSGTDLLITALNTLCKKDATAINQAIGTTAVSGSAAAQLLEYGFPWDQFLLQDKLIPNFLHLPGKIYPNFSPQMGSVWANIQELRNFPIARLFVDERGYLIFDSAFAAWNGTDTMTGAAIAPDILIREREVRGEPKFYQNDDDVVTSLSVMPSLLALGENQIQQISTLGKAITLDPGTAIKRFGYRYQEFQSQYDTPDALDKLKQRFPVLIQLHNSLWHASIRVRGDSKYRVGKRALLEFGGVNKNTRSSDSGKLKAWYITNVSHSGSWGGDWFCDLELRFPKDETIPEALQ